jgi:cob(I)alamin adenosyltransferase
VRVYTRQGDEGKTTLFHGGRVWKDESGPEAYGAVDEAVAALGAARALAGEELATLLLAAQRELFVVAAELATAPENRSKLEAGVSLATEEMVARLEEGIDELTARDSLPDEFVVPGGSSLEAALDVARVAVRRAERRAVTHARAGALEGSVVVRYLNRLADYVYVLARVANPDWEPSRVKEKE